MVAVVPGAEPWSSVGRGTRGRIGVVIVHGFTGSPAATRPLGQRLAREGYAVEVPLLPGHGTHHRDLARTRYADWYDAVDGVVEHLAARCAAVVVVGHSAGGTVALDLASRRPDDVAAVGVINPLIRRPPGLLPRLAPVLQHVVASVPRDLAGMPTDDIARPGVSEVAYGRVPSRAARSLIAELPRVRAQLLDVVQPLLIVRSLEDHTVPPADALELPQFVGSAVIGEVVCARSYHVPQLDHDADEVERAIVAFVDGVGGG